MDLTAGSLLDGRLHYAQPKDGYRTGLEPVLLAASVPARPGDSVLEAGTGAGAGLLCLTARVSGLNGVGVERDARMAGLAARNLAANDIAGCRIETANILEWRAAAPFDHALANPPWHGADGTASPRPAREAAKRAAPGLLAAWAMALAAALRPRGTLTLILPAASLGEGVAALQDADCAEITLFPLWPRDGQAAKLMVVRGVRHGRGACVLLPGLALHLADGAFTPAAQAVLRGGTALF